MIDWTALEQWILPPGGAVVLTSLIVSSYRKRRAGALTRAEQLNARADKAEKLAARYLAYIWVLLARWPVGTPKPPWPRGLKPKE